MYDRYNQLTWQQQLGNLAATLVRISSQATTPGSDKLVSHSLRETALFAEWSAPNIPPEFLPELAALQREVLAWHRSWPLDPARSLLALHARNRSDRVLQMAGLLETSPI
jgi:hypothetical protein